MIAISPWSWVGLAILSGLVSLAVVWLAGWLTATAPSMSAEARGTDESITFLFHGAELADDDLDLPATLPDRTDPISDWAGLKAWLGGRFAGIPDTPGDLTGDARLAAVDPADRAVLILRRQGDVLRVTLHDPAATGVTERHAALTLSHLQTARLAAAEHAPGPIGLTDGSGTLLWANAAGRALPDPAQQELFAGAPAVDTPRRISPRGCSEDRARWFDVTTQIDGDRYLHHATDVTSLVRAETARKELLQTLAKTFANLTTGLAVFDSNRQLALFNPALVDLTGLPAELLSGQPSLMEFFDRLRDRRVMPEPKDYGDWRKQIENMTDTAAGGLYVETWTLATGLTYRVTGRPHPDNAVAFLFEDISDEVSLRRRFRAQLDLRQAALDGMPAAVAVIGRDRVVTLCNAACRRMLGVDPESSFADMTATDLMTVCNRVFPNPSAWREIEARIKGARPSAPLKRRVTDDKGQKIGCRLAPLPDGALMLTLDRAETPVPENAALGA